MRKFLILSCVVALSLFSSGVQAQEEFYGYLPTDKLIKEDIYDFEPFALEEMQEKVRFALEKNDPETQYRLGRMYEEGIGVTVDCQTAVQFYEAAAKSGFVPAMVSLANIFLYGAEGVEANTARALSYLREAEKSGKPLVYYELGLYYENVGGSEQNFDKAFEYYQKAAKEKVLNAHVKLALFYQNGLGVEPDLRLAIKHYKLLKQLANDDNVSQYVSMMLGAIYSGVALNEQDPKKRFDWMLIAAQEGNIEAMFQLGSYYYLGYGTPKDFGKSAGWYLLAAQKDHAQAMTNLAYLYLNGYGIKKDYTKALEWFTTAAELGNPEAAWNVGNIYYYGYGVKQDMKMADTWFDRSKKLERHKAAQEKRR